MLEEWEKNESIVVIFLSTEYGLQKRFLGATNSQEIIILFIFEGHLADYLPDQRLGPVFQGGKFLLFCGSTKHSV